MTAATAVVPLPAQMSATTSPGRPLPELWEAVRWAVKPEGAVLLFAQCPYDKVLGASKSNTFFH